MRWPFFNFQTSVDALPAQTGTGMHFVFIWGEEGCGGGVCVGGGGRGVGGGDPITNLQTAGLESNRRRGRPKTTWGRRAEAELKGVGHRWGHIDHQQTFILCLFTPR